MDGAPLPPIRWRCCCQSWVDPMEEEGLRHTHERKLPIEMDLENSSQDADCIGLQLGLRREARKLFEERDGEPSMRTAKSRLLEICAAKCWSPPTFILSEEEGPDHQKRFIYKVTLKVESITTTILDCFSEAKLQEQAAEEHAAEAALWFLKHSGHF